MFRELMIQSLSEMSGLEPEKLSAVAGAARTQSPVTRDDPVDDDAHFRDYSDSGFPDPDQFDTYEDTNLGGPRDQQPVLPLANRALEILMRTPDVAVQFEQADYDRLVDVPGCQLLLEVVRTILVQDMVTPLVLLSKFQDQPGFDILSRLTESEPLLDISDLPAEYEGVLRKLFSGLEIKSKQSLRSDLLAKPLAEMSVEEREILRNLTRRDD
jgi:hypothetical protein